MHSTYYYLIDSKMITRHTLISEIVTCILGSMSCDIQLSLNYLVNFRDIHIYIQETKAQGGDILCPQSQDMYLVELGGSKDPFSLSLFLPPSHCHPEALSFILQNLVNFATIGKNLFLPSAATWPGNSLRCGFVFYLLCIFQVSGPACSHHFITFQISQVLSCDPLLPPDCHLSGALLFSSQTWTAHQEVLCAEDSFFPPLFFFSCCHCIN